MALKLELSFYAAIDVIQGQEKAGSTNYEKEGNLQKIVKHFEISGKW